MNGDADLVVIVRELADPEPDALNALSAIAAAGPERRAAPGGQRTACRRNARRLSVLQAGRRERRTRTKQQTLRV